MKHRVAFAFPVVLSVIAIVNILIGAGVAQTTKPAKSKARKPGRETINKPPNETLKICQGVPIPSGYVVTAFLTSSTCPHGMYILKKQDPYSESLGISKRASAEPGPKPASSSKPVGTSASSPQGARTSAPANRPRRVVTPDESGDAPVLHGSYKVSEVRPPTLTSANALGSPVNEPEDSSPNTEDTPGPEEVSEGDVVRVETNLVTVPVSVLDRQGRFIPNLSREDFIVFENEVEQSIAYFEPADKPFAVALLLDTSPSTHFHLWEIKEAAIAFAKQLRPQDRVLIVSFNDQVLLLTEVTNDLNIINSVIVENAKVGTSTRLYDAIELVIKERLDKIKGRKAIVLFTDGVDTASNMATYESNMREVDELDALIYPIQYDTTDYLRAMQGAGSITVVTTQRGPFGSRSTSQATYPTTSNSGVLLPGATKADYDRADQYLNALAYKSGGRLFKANDSKQLSDAFSRIAEELRRQYTLGYYPQASGAERNERNQIKVRVKRPNVAVKARDSYVRSAPTPATK